MSKTINFILSLFLCIFLFSCNLNSDKNIIGQYSDNLQKYLLYESNGNYYLEYGDKSRSELIKKVEYGTTFFYLKRSKGGDYFRLDKNAIVFYDNQGYIETIRSYN